MTRYSRRIGLALFAALLLAFAGGAQATSFNLGNVSGPFQFFAMNTKWTGPFVDRFHFTIDPGVSLIFHASFNQYSFRHWNIADMDGTLSDASGVILNGDATTVEDSGPYPRRLVTFPALQVGPGHYYVTIFGHAFSEVGPGAQYAGTITLTRTPLPASLLLMLTALGGFGLLRWPRKSTDAEFIGMP